MNIIESPGVFVVGRQTVDEAGLKAFLSSVGVEWSPEAGPANEVLCETAGKLCYMSLGTSKRPGGRKAYLDNIIGSGHGSVLEHSIWNLVLTGISRSLSHELVRHRAGTGFSQLSQRYVDESDTAFVVPPALRDEVRLGLEIFRSGWANPSFSRGEEDCLLLMPDEPLSPEERAGVLWLRACAASREAYAALNDYLQKRDEGKHATRTEARKAARQTARSVLPNAAETRIFLTLNGRAARNIIEQRCSRHADAEIRILAGKLWEALKAESPLLFSDYVREDLPDGTFCLSTPNPKV